MSYLIGDFDFLAYTVACVFQEIYIIASHPKLPESVKLDNRTALWGHHSKKDGGWLADYNASTFSDLKPEEFTITEHQEPLSLQAAKRSIDTRIQGLLEETGASSYKGYVGRGDVFRVGVSTLLEYKGNRSDIARPLHLTALKQYLVDEHNCEWVEIIESDDAVAIAGKAAYDAWRVSKKSADKGIMVFQDKDLCQVEGWQYQVGQMTQPELRVGLGKLWRDDKGKVRGWGRLFLYWQSLRFEQSDNFSASCFSDVKWGDIKAYNLLVDCKTDKQAFQALLTGFKTLYPAPKTVTGWRGTKLEIDALYVMEECFNLAKMLRVKGEPLTNIKDVLTKLEIYE